ncbi:MAG: hypothetical protein ACOX36_04620 [Saccharofermentanales bacterium]
MKKIMSTNRISASCSRTTRRKLRNKANCDKKNAHCNASKRINSLFILLLNLLLLFPLLNSQPVEARENIRLIPVDLAQADVQIRADNTVIVTETFYYTYQGENLSIAFDIGTSLSDDMTIVGIKKARVENGELKDLVNITPKDETRPQSITYKTEKQKEGTRIIVDLSSISGTFAIQITYQWVAGVIKLDRHAMVANSLCSAPKGTKIDNLIWSITLPSGIAADQADILAVTSHPTAILQEKNVLTIVDNHPFICRRGMGIVLRLPLSAFPLASTKDGFKLTSAEIVSDARNRREMLIQLELLYENSTRIIGILSLTALLFLLILQVVRKWTPRRRKFLQDYLYWPATAPPAFISILQRNRLRDSDILLSTLLSLTAKKEVAFIDEIFIWRNPDRMDFSSFTTWEILLLQWLFEDDSKYGSVLAAERLRVAARQPEFRMIAQNFRKTLSNDFNRSRLVKRRLTVIFRVSSLILAALFALIGIIIFLFTRIYGSFILLAVALSYAINGLTYTCLSRYGAQRRWETLRFAETLGTPRKIILSCQNKLTDVESAITSLPAAVALDRVGDYFFGIKNLPDELFYKTAYAILHVFRDLPIPRHIRRRASSSERKMLFDELNQMERMLTVWDALLKSCLI